jgi:hypothetical protein
VNVIAIIADVVDSRRIARRADFQRALKAALIRVSRRSRKNILSPYTLTLGDEFQAAYARFDSLFTDVVDIAFAIHPAPVRFAVSYGPLSTDLNPKAALEMDGRAFNDARDLLHRLKKEKRSIIQLTAAGVFDVSLADVSLRLFCNELRTWNRNTFSIFLSLLQGGSVEEAAERASVSRRAAYKAIASHHLKDCIELFGVLAAELNRGLKIDGGA